jgi:predicted RNA binding protein YcfA (HicA-like mRNA interferase family)
VKIPRDCNGRDLIKALRVLGYEPVRSSGSHIVLTTLRDGEHHVTIPEHRPLKVGTLHDVLKAVAQHHRLPVDELLNVLRI